MPPGGKVLTAEELEASLTKETDVAAKQQSNVDYVRMGQGHTGRAIVNSSAAAAQRSDLMNMLAMSGESDANYGSNHHQSAVFTDNKPSAAVSSSNDNQNMFLPPFNSDSRNTDEQSNSFFSKPSNSLEFQKFAISSSSLEEDHDFYHSKLNEPSSLPDKNTESINKFDTSDAFRLDDKRPENFFESNSELPKELLMAQSGTDEPSLFSSPLAADTVLQCGKVKTVAELEADLALHGGKNSGQAGRRHAASASSVDMAAFNKLLGMMNAKSSASAGQQHIHLNAVSDALSQQLLCCTFNKKCT